MSSAACSLSKNDVSNCGLPKNLSKEERGLSLGGGILMLAIAARRGGASGLLAAGVGAGLLFRSVTGHCALKQQLHEAQGGFGLRSRERGVPAQRGVHAESTVLINRPAEELFAFWKDPANLPRVVKHITHVEATDEGRWSWTAEGVWGELHWETVGVNERENELIAWESLAGGDVQMAGSLRFRSTGDRGTAVSLTIKYHPPGGQIADALAWFRGEDLRGQIQQDLLNFKRLMETGELPRTKPEDDLGVRMPGSSGTMQMFLSAGQGG